MCCMAEREFDFQMRWQITLLLIFILLTLSILGHYIGDAFAPSPGSMSSAVQVSGRSNMPIAHLLHYVLALAGAVGLGLLVDLTFSFTIRLHFDVLISFPPPNRPPIVAF